MTDTEKLSIALKKLGGKRTTKEIVDRAESGDVGYICKSPHIKYAIGNRLMNCKTSIFRRHDIAGEQIHWSLV